MGPEARRSNGTVSKNSLISAIFAAQVRDSSSLSSPETRNASDTPSSLNFLYIYILALANRSTYYLFYGTIKVEGDGD